MDEEKDKQMVPKEAKAAEDSGKGDKYETTPVIERAREERERMEKVVEEMRIENDRKEQIVAKEALGGSAEAGQPAVPELSEEEKASRERVMAVGRATGANWAKPKEDEIHK